ncbi:hypothetical protein [Neorhizobium sp. SOG26]|uniref:hypothetical protein n=1 Tax=Neorhizobium sp. SOG26 TaxID=2060726 RepID=UPI001237319B|nr:hypothetical protein [Neorhizobium sp. SOG26]
MKIQMHEDEIKLFSSFLTEADSYFEFGMGGSTILASTLVRKRIHAVDTSAEWVGSVAEQIGRETGREIQLSHIDVGPTGGWGTPTSREHEHRFPSYSKAILNTGFSDYDLCLVDGRFRVACFLEALRYLPLGSVLGMHDYSPRPEYHLVEEFARPIASSRTLSFFVRRPDCNFDNLVGILEEHRSNWA